MSKELFRINDIEIFSRCMEKLTVNPTELNNEEKNYILTIAALLMKKYSIDKRYISYAELAYFIILNYSLAFKEYDALYDFSISFGLYPISYALTKNSLITFDNISDSLLELQIERKYKRNNIIQTYDQRNAYDELLESNNIENSFIAPTSYGKSSIIFEHIKNNYLQRSKFAIIVPTKALLMQTYRDVKKLGLNCKIITHDEMYKSNFETFIAVLTQERAFRLLNKFDIAFDYMYIDEAHQLLEKDSRSLLLTRLIKLNRKRKSDFKIFYFSPLIADSENITYSESQSIFEKRIKFNMKESVILEYRNDEFQYVYNRFLNKFYRLNKRFSDLFNYIDKNKKNKNFIYLYTPKKIQLFAHNYLETLKPISSEKIDLLIHNLNTYIHPEFYLIDCIKKGVIYLHGKLPDNIREYLLSYFTKIPEIKTIIANTVILEGMNLPIDSLFILSGSGLQKKDLINLIGRVNRLSSIFGEQLKLESLQPNIHFVNSDEYNRIDGSLKNKIELLKSTGFSDDVKNPLLERYTEPIEVNKVMEDRKIKEEDSLFFSSISTPIGKLKKQFIELGIHNIYNNIDRVSEIILDKLNGSKFPEINSSVHVMDRINYFFISDVDEEIMDDEFSRLKHVAAISYYKMFLENRKLSLKEKIAREISFFNKQIASGKYFMYVGSSFGEISNPYNGNQSGNKVYINLSLKSPKELVNFAIIKQKQEEDFVSFKLFMFLQLLLEYKQVTQDEYNEIIYGSTDEKDINLIKLGLPINLITKFKNDNQIDNIKFDENLNIQCNDQFIEYKNSLDDFIQFEIEKII